jgi:hypothetical protein
MSTDFATTKAYLSRNEGGNSVFSHLSNVLLKLAAENPADALRAFETHSGTVKQCTFVPGAGEGLKTKGKGVEQAAEASSIWASETTALYRRTPKASQVKMLTPAVKALEWAGVGVNAEEAHRIDRALEALANVEDVKALRFWGRIQGRSLDYYILEGELKNISRLADSPQEESGIVGANRYTYWVSSHVGGPEAWTKLDNVTTAQLKSAPLLRRYFTGALDAPVGGHPAFPGNEAAYLRAVIGHISASTSVCPADMFVAGEGDDDGEFLSQENAITLAEEIDVDLESLTSAGGWSHYVAGINAAGRCKNYVPRTWDEEENAFQPEPDEDAEEEITALRELDEGEEENPNWTVCGAGQQQAIKSQVWPGAVTVASNESFTNYYCGFGVPRAASQQYVPRFPGNLSVEFDIGELREANDITEKPAEPEVENEDDDE